LYYCYMFNTVVFKLIFRLSNTTKKQKLFPHLTKRLPAEPKVYPNQYPVKINDSSLSLISRERPVRFVTPKDEVIEDCDIPHNIRAMSQTYKNKWESPPNSYSLNIGVLGLTNSGKSALVGRLAHKISAVSPKAHTTG
jgi:GTPase Era involved in 16S rRNA processing